MGLFTDLVQNNTTRINKPGKMFDDLVSEENLTGPQKQSSQKKGLFSDLIETPSVKEELVGPPMSLAGPQAMIRKMSAGPSPIEKPVAEPTQIPLSGFRPPVIEEPMRLTAGKPSDIKKTKPENWKYYSPIEKFTYNLEENKLSGLADRFSKQFLNSWSRVGQGIATHPFSPVGISQKESDKYFNQAMTELQSTGRRPTEVEIRQRANELAAMKKFPTMAVEPRKNKTELVTDVAAGLSSFVAQLALLKKIMPSNTPDAIVWEAQNQITGGTPGEGAAMRLTLGQIGKIPTGKLSGKLAKVGLESSLFASYSYLLGGDLDEIIISAMIPVTFNAYSFAQMKNHITKYESQLRNDALSAHQRRLQTGMNPATSNAYLKADLRKVDTWVAKAKQKIYQDDAFAPAREKWETIRQNAYKDLGKGGKKAQAAQRVIDWMESQPGGGQQPPTERPIEIKPPITITRPAVGEEALARAKATTIGQSPPVMPQQAPKAVKPAIPEISPTLPVMPGIAQEAPQKPVERRTVPEAPEAKQQEIVQPAAPVTPEKPSKKGYEITQDEIAPIFAKAQANGINANTVINTFQKEFTGVVQNKQEALLAYNMLAEGRTPLEIKTELNYNRKQAENVILPPKEEKISEVWKPKEETPEQAPQEEIAPEIETEKQNVKEDMIQVDRWQTKEFSEGKNAALRDKGENPYSENSIQWKTWNEGWNSVEPEKMGTIKESQEAPQKPSEVVKEPTKAPEIEVEKVSTVRAGESPEGLKLRLKVLNSTKQELEKFIKFSGNIEPELTANAKQQLNDVQTGINYIENRLSKITTTQEALKKPSELSKESTGVYQKEGEKAIDFAKEAAKKKPLGAKEIAEKPRLIKGEGVYLKNNKEYGKLVVQSIDFVKADKVAGVDAQYFITAKDEQGKIITGRPDQFEKASAVDFRESKVETKAKPTEKVKQPVEGNWKLGQERPFKFDVNSTKNEGRFRLYPPELITGKYRSQTSIKSRNIPETPGVRFLLSKTKDGKSVIQTIRFDKSMFTEEQAAKWWNENKDRFEFYKPPQGKMQASIGAAKSPELDKALQRASKKTKTSYVVQKNGKWIVSSQKPQYGDYYLISANESSLVKGETKFAEKDEAVKAARYMAKSKNGPVYIQKTEKGFIVSEQKPSAEHIKIMPESPGLTKQEIQFLSKKTEKPPGLLRRPLYKLRKNEKEITKEQRIILQKKGYSLKEIARLNPKEAIQIIESKSPIEKMKEAQEKGEKVGFKAGRAEAIKEARQKLDRFMMAVKLTDQLRRDAAEIVKEYIPKELQYRYIKRILEAKTNKRIDNLTKAMNLYLDRAEKKAARKDFVNFIKQTKRKYGRGEVPFGKLRNDVRQELIKVLELYDTMKLSGEKKEELESRDEYIKRIAGTVADAFESLEDMGKDILQMPSARIEELDRLRKIHIGELDADQIRYIQSSLDHLIKIAERKGDIKNRIKSEKLGKLINTARQEVHDKSKKPGVTTELTGVLGLVPKVLSTAQATPHTLTGYITGKDNKATMEIINDNLVNITKDKNNVIKNFVESYRKMLKDAGLTQADEKLLDEKIQIKYGGKTFSSDIDNLLGIYMDIRAEGNLQRILKAGRVFDVYHRDPKWGYIVRHTKIRTGRPGLEELREITDFVENKNPKLKKMADLYFKHNFEIQTPQVNKISMEYQNYELARKEKYWHMSRVMPLGIEGKKTDISISIENQGRFLPRTGGRQPFRNITFRQGVISNLQANAAYSAMTIPMQDIKALISDKRWQDTVIRNGLEKELKTLVVMLRRTQGMITSQDFIDLFGAKVLNNFGKYALSLRLSGYGVQTASIPAAFEIIEPKYFIAPRSIANLPRIPIKDIKEMMELSPTLWMRWTLRQFDYAIGSVASQNAYHNLLWSEKSPTEKLLNHYTWGDQKAIYQIYLAAQEKVAAETKLKRGTQEFKEAAIKITEDALETQPQWDMIYRNELTSSPNVLLRGSLMFQSARNAQYNVLLRAVDDYKKGRIGPGEAGKRISGVVYANILVAVVKRLIKMGIFFGALGLLYLISDEKEKKEKIKRTFRTKAGKVPGQVAIDSALNFISLPAFGSLTQNIAYETIQRIKYPNMKKDLQDIRTGNIFIDLTLDVTGLVADTGLMTKYLITGEKFKSGKDEGKPKWKRSAIEVADQLAELIAIRTGLPYSAPKGEIYYQIRSAEKSIEKTMSDRELIIAFKKTKTKNGVVKKGMEKKNRELYEEIQKRKKQRQ